MVSFTRPPPLLTQPSRNIIFHVDSSYSTPTANRSLDVQALDSLPIFAFSSTAHLDFTPECIVCLLEFEENESGQTLPSCNHIFPLTVLTCGFSLTPLARSVKPSSNDVSPEHSKDVFLWISNLVVNGPELSAGPKSCFVCASPERVGTSLSDDGGEYDLTGQGKHGEDVERKGLTDGFSIEGDEGKKRNPEAA